MEVKRATLAATVVKTAVVHTVTYFIVGFVAFTVFDYTARFAEPGLGSLMRPTDDPLVAAGPLFAPIRGVLFGVVFYLLRDALFGRNNGWLTMWIVLVFLGIFSTFGPAPGSLEGLIYTTLPVDQQLFGLVEVLVQSLLLAAVTFYWVNHPEERWLTWTLGILFGLVMLLPALGLMVAGAS